MEVLDFHARIICHNILQACIHTLRYTLLGTTRSIIHYTKVLSDWNQKIIGARKLSAQNKYLFHTVTITTGQETTKY